MRGSRTRRRWRSGWPSVVFSVVVLVMFGLFQYWHQIDAWLTTTDLPHGERRAVLKAALTRGEVLAMRDGAEPASLAASRILEAGNSRCTWENHCSRYSHSRRGIDRCTAIDTAYFCAYELIVEDGTTAVGILKTRPNAHYMPAPFGANADHWLFQRMVVDPLDAATGREKLCELGYCAPGALSRWKDRGAQLMKERRDAEAKRIALLEREAAELRDCGGPRVELIGKGMVCLGLAAPETREFRECKGKVCGPDMVALPKGAYKRGTSEADLARLLQDHPEAKDWAREEVPQREVKIEYWVAIGKFEITFEQWQACYDDFACAKSRPPADEGWGRGRRPVIWVSWDAIQNAYLPWLNAKLGLTGETAYRLPSEGEWEYAARAGATTRYAWGDTLTRSQAQFEDSPNSSRGFTVEVGSFPANAFGVHDMHGNVAEWVADCVPFIHDYATWPMDGSANAPRETCTFRAYRGGSWVSAVYNVRSASRYYADPRQGGRSLGFRLARTLRKGPPPP